MAKKYSPKKKKRELTFIDCTRMEGKLHPALQRYFGYCLYKSAMRFRTLLDRAVEKYGLFTSQLGILRLVSESGNLSQQELGDYMGIDKASMVKFLDQLENAGFLTRNAHKVDRRVKLVELTAKGKKILDEVASVRNEVEEKFLAPLYADERDQIRKIIPKLVS
jgi:DNA-binding MarR family transcriptional regulator